MKPVSYHSATATFLLSHQKVVTLNYLKNLAVTTFFVGNKQSHFLPYLSVYNFKVVKKAIEQKMTEY